MQKIFFLYTLNIGSTKKSPRKKSPPDPKPNPIPNLTLTLTLTPHGGAFFRGGAFFLTPLIYEQLRTEEEGHKLCGGLDR